MISHFLLFSSRNSFGVTAHHPQHAQTTRGSSQGRLTTVVGEKEIRDDERGGVTVSRLIPLSSRQSIPRLFHWFASLSLYRSFLLYSLCVCRRERTKGSTWEAKINNEQPTTSLLTTERAVIRERSSLPSLTQENDGETQD